VWLTAIVWLAARLSAILSRSGIRRRMERLTGLAMVGFGVRLAIERL
jgi:threonine/homoserine/homoserine lactone efflux protein